MILNKRCTLEPDTIIRAYAFYGGNMNHPMVILCQEARENGGKCHLGRKYICEFGDFTSLPKKDKT